MHLKSDLDYNKVAKSMEKYQKVKKLMHKNKRARLPSLESELKQNRNSIFLERSASRKDDSLERSRRMETENNMFETIHV